MSGNREHNYARSAEYERGVKCRPRGADETNRVDARVAEKGTNGVGEGASDRRSAARGRRPPRRADHLSRRQGSSRRPSFPTRRINHQSTYANSKRFPTLPYFGYQSVLLQPLLIKDDFFRQAAAITARSVGAILPSTLIKASEKTNSRWRKAKKFWLLKTRAMFNGQK